MFFTGHIGKFSRTFRLHWQCRSYLFKLLIQNAQFHFKKSDEYTIGGVQRGFIVHAKYHFSILGCSAGICSV